MWTNIKTKLKNWWDTVFTPYASIAYARVMALISGIAAVFGAIDWSPVISLVQSGTGFNNKQLFWTAGVAFLAAIGVEIARRSNAPDLKA